MKNLKGTLILLIAALAWGGGFVAQTSAADSVGSFSFNAFRAVPSVIFLLAVILIRNTITKKWKKTDKKTLIAGVECGVILFFAMFFQQYGMSLYPPEAASSGRAGFITATYVILGAIFTWFKDKKIKPLVAVATVMCMAGMYLLCLSGGISNIYIGDLVVFICAILYTVYLFAVDRFSDCDGLKISCIQFVVSGFLSAVAMFIFEKPEISQITGSWQTILYAGIVSSGIGYTMQIIGQKFAEPTVASITMSLESVFAVLAGWLILHETLSSAELFGCFLMFAAVVLSQLPQKNKKILNAD